MAESGPKRDALTQRDFDRSYYERYYLNRATRVADPVYFDNVARFVSAYCTLIELKVHTILDLGCGIGSLKKPLLKCFSGARYTGVDASEYACRKYGWELATASDYRGAGADLVICHDVLQYLRPGEAKAAIKNFAGLCDGMLFFSVLTREDWQAHCDQARTDGDVYMRDASWYRSKLSRGFKNLGGGCYLSRSSDVAVYALEHID